MDLRDMIAAVKDGWRWVAIAVGMGAVLATGYLILTSVEYQASAEVVVLANGPETIPEAEQGATMSAQLADTVASIIDSPAVLEDLASDSLTTSELMSMTDAVVRDGTSTIGIVVRSTDADAVAAVANEAAESARRTVPEMLGDDGVNGKLPVTVEIITPAVEPSSPVSPNAQGVLVIGVALGLCAGLALALLTAVQRPAAPQPRERRQRLRP
jgi:capsular polysaccharide biosynthesis protein